jgi:serine phosphatase RsbU (regulator of sigma subunit)
MALLADVPARVGPLEASAAYRPASGPGAGGDFFDVFELADGRVVALIGDVSGHGQRALAQTAFIHYSLRTWMQDGFEPRQALYRASSALGSDLETSFVTALICVYDPHNSTLTWASAGHPLPLLVGAAVKLAPIMVAAAPPVGMGMSSGQRQTVVTLPKNVLVCLHTDGLNEAPTGEGERLGEDGLELLLQLHNTSQLDAEALLDAVAEVADTTNDDMAAVLLRAPDTAAAKCEIISEDLEVSLDDDLELVEQFAYAGGLSDSEVARALAAVSSERGPGTPALLRIFPRTHTFEVQGGALAENHFSPQQP